MASAIFVKALFVRRAIASSLPSFRNMVSKPWQSSSCCYSSLVRMSPPLPSGFVLRSLALVPEMHGIWGSCVRLFATRPSTSSLNDPSPNWSNRPPKETILLDGCDFEHWLCVMEPPEGEPTRDEIIDSYIKTLAQVVGSEEEARKKIYSVSTKHYFAFGALVSEELSYKIKELPKVRWVLPDSYLDVKNKDYGGEPFIDGQAVPYDPKYHEEWVRNNARANERSRRNDRPRNFDRSRNFERRRENMQNRDFQSRDMPPIPNRDFQGPPPTAQNPTPAGQPGNVSNNNFHANAPDRNFPNNNFQGNVPDRNFPNNNFPGNAPNRNFQGNVPNNNFQGNVPPNNFQGNVPPNSNFQGNIPFNNFQGNGPYNNFQGNVPSNSFQGNTGGGNFPNRDMGSTNTPNRDYQRREMPNNHFQGGGYQANSSPNTGYQGNTIPTGDGPPSPNENYPPMP